MDILREFVDGGGDEVGLARGKRVKRKAKAVLWKILECYCFHYLGRSSLIVLLVS